MIGEKISRNVYFAAIVPPAAVIAIAALQPWVPLAQLTRDPIAAARVCAEANPTLALAGMCSKNYFGVISNLGVLVWWATASICLYSYMRIFRTGHRNGAGLLAYSGIFSALLMADDFFLGHEVVYPKLFGISEEVVFVFYAVAFICYFSFYFRSLVKLEYPILAISILLFGMSIFFDVYIKISAFDFMNEIIPKDGLWYRIGEDGAKFVGIWAWAVFHIRAAQILTNRAERLVKSA